MPTYGLQFSRREHCLRVGLNTRFKKGTKHSEEWKLYISNKLKGRKFTKEHREKLSKALIGNKRNYHKGKPKCIDCGKLLRDYGAKRCLNHSKIGLNLREKNGRWQGGKSFELYPLGWTKTFKEQIRYRDNYKCQLCGVPEPECMTKLHIHHIDYDKKNLNKCNLISLCRDCHMRTNYNRENWKKYFIENMEKINESCIRSTV